MGWIRSAGHRRLKLVKILLKSANISSKRRKDATLSSLRLVRVGIVAEFLVEACLEAGFSEPVSSLGCSAGPQDSQIPSPAQSDDRSARRKFIRALPNFLNSYSNPPEEPSNV